MNRIVKISTSLASPGLSANHTHTHTVTHTQVFTCVCLSLSRALSHTHSLSLSLSLSLALSLSLSLSFALLLFSPSLIVVTPPSLDGHTSGRWGLALHQYDCVCHSCNQNETDILFVRHNWLFQARPRWHVVVPNWIQMFVYICIFEICLTLQSCVKLIRLYLNLNYIHTTLVKKMSWEIVITCKCAHFVLQLQVFRITRQMLSK